MKKLSSQSGLKLINQQKVLNLIYSDGPISRVEIADRIFLTQQTVTNIVQRLINEGLVEEGISSTSAVGRKPIPLKIKSEQLFAIGIEVAVKYIRGRLVDFDNNIIARHEIAIETENTFESLFSVIQVLMNYVPDKNGFKGIGLSIPGIVDAENGIVVKSVGLPWENYPLIENLRKVFDVPIYMEHDVNLLAIIENEAGVLSDSQNNITIKFDHQIGGAIVYQKNLFRGSTFAAGEFGHIKVFKNEHSYFCDYCQTTGCFTTLASASGLQENKGISLETFTERLEAGKPDEKEILETINEAISFVLGNIITVTNPDSVLVLGKVIDRIGDRIIPEITKRIHATVPENCREVEIIQLAERPDESILAAKLVEKHFFDVPFNLLSL